MLSGDRLRRSFAGIAFGIENDREKNDNHTFLDLGMSYEVLKYG